MKEVQIIKNKNPNIRIYGTLHDRQHNYEKLDYYDLYYQKNVANALKYSLVFVLKRLYFNIHYHSWIKRFDKVFTVSNYSLQKLTTKSIKSISWYMQPSNFVLDDDTCEDDNNDDFALFVGGNRPEKNLLRTIEAFLLYATKHTDLDLYVTGVNEELIERFVNKRKLNRTMVQERIKLFGYLPDDELNQLYSKCKFVIFTSKAEGFGLPVLEAIFHNKAVIASYATSIPEVGGAAVKYVNPYSIESIAAGIEYMSKEENRTFYSQMAYHKRKILENNISIDSKALIKEIFD